MIYSANFSLSEILESFEASGITFSNILVGGVDYGGTAKWLSQYTNGKVFCFEPFPGNWPFIEKEGKKGSSIVLVKKALYDENAKMNFYVSGVIKSDPGIVGSIWNNMGRYISLGYVVKNIPQQAVEEQLYRVDCVRADDEIPASCPVQFIKLDLQGSELAALRGMERIQKDALFIYVEYTGQPGLLEYLEQKGMLIFEQTYFFNCAPAELPPGFEFIQQRPLSTGAMATFARHAIPYVADGNAEFLAYKKVYNLGGTELVCVPASRYPVFETCLNNLGRTRGLDFFTRHNMENKKCYHFPQTFHISWKLLDGFNHACSYSHEPANILDENFSESRIMNTAHEILSLGREAYYFDLYGGEPSIHPYAASLVKYLVTSGRKVKIRFQTNGLAPLNWYRELLRLAPPKTILLHLDTHPKYIRIKGIMELADLVTSYGQLIFVNVNIDPDFLRESNALLKAMRPYLQEKLGGLSVTVFSNNKGESTRKTIILNEKNKHQEKRDFLVNDGLPFHAVGYCVLGAGGCYVGPNGTPSLGLIANDEPYALKIIQNPTVRAGVPGGPVFEDLAAAQTILKDFKIKSLEAIISSGPVRAPDAADRETDDYARLIRQRMRHAGVSSNEESCSANPDLWLAKACEIQKVYANLADRHHRDIFAHFLKAALLGNKKYLYPGHDVERNCEGAPPFTDLENESKRLAKARWRGDDYCVCLKLSHPWLDCLALLAEAHNDRDIILEMEGENLLARSQAFLPSCWQQPDGGKVFNNGVTFIFYNPASENLPAQFQAFFRSNGIEVECLILVTPQTPAPVAKKLRVAAAASEMEVMETEELNAAELWAFAIANSRGKYVCINPAPALGAYYSALTVMDKCPNSDILLCLDYPQYPAGATGHDALLGFLRDMGRLPGLAGHIYRRVLMEKASTTPAVVLPEDFQNFAALYFAREVATFDASRITSSIFASPQATLSFVLETLPLFIRAFDLDGELLQEAVMHYLEYAELDEVDSTAVRSAAEIICGKSQSFLQRLCESLAATYDLKMLSPILDSAPIMSVSPIAISHPGPFPISIIIAQNSAIMNWREAAELEEIDSVEWVLVDNGNDEDIAYELEDLTSLLPNIKLLRTQERQSLADCFNAGLKVASGNTVMFSRGDSLPLPGLTERIRRLPNDFPEKDLFIFALAHDVVDWKVFAQKDKSPSQILNLFTEGHLSFDIERLVYRKDFLSACKLLFDPVTPCPVADFIIKSIAAAKSMLCMDMAACSVAPEFGSTLGIVPKSLESVGRLFGLVEKLVEQDHDLGNSIGSYILRNVWLPAYAALRDTGQPVGDLPASTLFKCAAFAEYLNVLRERRR